MTTDPSPPAAPTANAGTQLGGVLATTGASLAGLIALYELFTIGAGLSFQERQFPGDELHRVGVVAASAVDLRLGVGLVLAAVLAACGRSLLPGGLRPERPGTGAGPAPTAPPATVAAGALILVSGTLAVVLAVLAVRAQYHNQHLRNTAATTAFHLSQATYVVGVVGPALLALAVTLRAVVGGGTRR